MTNQPKMIRQVYCELRRSLGDEAPASEVLRLASAIVAASKGKLPDPGYRLVEQRPVIEELPLDQAFADGGYRVMESERAWHRQLYADEPPQPTDANPDHYEMELAA